MITEIQIVSEKDFLSFAKIFSGYSVNLSSLDNVSSAILFQLTLTSRNRNGFFYFKSYGKTKFSHFSQIFIFYRNFVSTLPLWKSI